VKGGAKSLSTFGKGGAKQKLRKKIEKVLHHFFEKW
jgi:hypothetical protein